MLNAEVNEKLAARLNIPVKSKKDGEPSFTVIVKSSQGGIENPTPYITNPKKTVVIAGKNDEEGWAFAEEAEKAGLGEEQIFFMPVKLKELVEAISRLMEADGGNEDISWSTDTVNETRAKTIAVAGLRGGVGRSTVAASLADYFKGIGEKVAIIDLGSPPVTNMHFGIEAADETRDGMVVLKGDVDIYVPETGVWDYPSDNLQKIVSELNLQYRRVIIDLPPEPRHQHMEAINPDCLVVVFDYDMILSAKPAAAVQGGIFVYNKAVPEVSQLLAASILGDVEPIVIKMDIEGCNAALSDNKPAYVYSEAVAQGIGQLAAKIG